MNKKEQISLLVATVATMTSREIAESIINGSATQADADSFTLSVIEGLVSALASTGLTDPSKLTASEARTLLDASDLERTRARWCVSILQKHYPSSAKVLSDTLTAGLFADATIIPALMLGNIDVLDRRLKGVSTYIIKSPESGLIKIGKSIKPHERIRSLETGSGCRLQVMAVVKKDIESKLHKQFSDLRVFGEWFSDDGRIAAYAREVAA